MGKAAPGWEAGESKAAQQFDAIAESIAAIAQLDFSRVAPILGQDENLDAVAVGLNSLAEELKISVVSRDRVRSILNALTDALLLLTPSGNVRFVNKAASRLLGQAAETVMGQPLADFLELPSICDDENMEILPLGTSPTRSLGRLLVLPGNQRVPVVLSCAPMVEDSDQPTDYLCLLWGRVDGGLAGGWVPGSDTGRVPFRVSELIEEVVDFHRPIAEARDIDMQLEIGAGIPEWVLGARTPLQQVLHALTSSALEWTESGSVIFHLHAVVAPATRRAVLRFRVENEGGKVNERRRDELFRPVDVAEDFTNSGSHFLGLNISAASVIAEGMGGQLGIAQHPSGTSFARLWVDLPLISNS